LKKYQAEKHTQGKRGQNYPVDDNMISSVSAGSFTTSSWSTYDEFGVSVASRDERNAGVLHNAQTMETDMAHARGIRNGRSTPQTLRAFRSKSWKLDDGDTENSIMLSESAPGQRSEESKSADRSGSPSYYDS
jgi:hypothetical protein